MFCTIWWKWLNKIRTKYTCWKTYSILHGLTRFFFIMWIAKYKWKWITAILQPIMSFTIFALCYFTVLCLVFRHFFAINVLLSPAMVALIVKMIVTTLLGWSLPTLSTSTISWKIKWNKAIYPAQTKLWWWYICTRLKVQHRISCPYLLKHWYQRR